MNELSHERKDVGIVGCGGKDHLAVAEGFGNRFRHIRAREIDDGNGGTSVFGKFVGKEIDGFLGVAVNGRVGYENGSWPIFRKG